MLSAQDSGDETILNKDSNKRINPFQKETQDDDEVPGAGMKFTPAQDSAYTKAMRMQMPVSTRLRMDLLAASNPLIDLDKLNGQSKSFAPGLEYLPKDAYKPDGNMMVQYQETLMRAFDVPFARTYDPYQGIRIGLSDIAQFFGFAEDNTPTIKFRVKHYTKVEIVIYSIQASVVATIFEGNLPPGSYERTWNGRDGNGRKLPAGDYIGEVRIQGETAIRKRIILQ